MHLTSQINSRLVNPDKLLETCWKRTTLTCSGIMKNQLFADLERSAANSYLYKQIEDK